MSAAVLVTGGGGYLGRQVVSALASEGVPVVSLDLHAPAPEQRVTGAIHVVGDIRHADLGGLMRDHGVATVVHLAAIVNPGKRSNRALEYEVDVEGTRRVLEACVAARVQHLIVSSSGAAYGYHADNPAWLRESDALRGNREFAYAWHKRLVEEELAQARQQHPALRQTVLRIGTILGATVRNQITALFEKPRPLAIAGADSPFVFIWDQDVVGVILHAVRSGKAGLYNVAGDGALGLRELAARMGKRCRVLPAGILQTALWVGRRLRLTQYGPEQLRFLRYRPVLDNRALKEDFGYTPRKTSAEAFDYWWQHRRPRPHA